MLGGGGGRGRKGCGTSPGGCFWPLAAWAVALATGICTGSQPSPPATTRSRLVARHPVSHHPVPRRLDPPTRTLLLLLAWRQAPNRVTTWRYVASWGKRGVSCGQTGLQLEKEETGAVLTGSLFVEPLGSPPACGTQGEQMGPVPGLCNLLRFSCHLGLQVRGVRGTGCHFHFMTGKLRLGVGRPLSCASLSLSES